MNSIKFIDGDGKEFFGCTPAEARMAQKAIEDKRQNVDVLVRETQRLTALFQELMVSIKKTEVCGMRKYALDGLTGNVFIELFLEMESKNFRVTDIFINAVRYADLRMWNKDIMDIETKAYKLRTGLMGTIWGADVVVSREIPEDEIAVVSSWREDPGDGSRREDQVLRYRLIFTGAPKVVSSEDRMTAMEALLAKIAEKVGVE